MSVDSRGPAFLDCTMLVLSVSLGSGNHGNNMVRIKKCSCTQQCLMHSCVMFFLDLKR